MIAVFVNCAECLYGLWFPLRAPPEIFRVECPRCEATFSVATKEVDDVPDLSVRYEKVGTSHG